MAKALEAVEAEVGKTLCGEEYSIVIDKDGSGKTFGYRLMENLPEGTVENVLMEGDGFESVDAVIEDLSFLHTALRSVFG